MSSTPASMLQIVAAGLQDRERLNTPGGQPSIQFYKSVMRRRTRWASQWRRVEFDNLADFGRTAVCTLPILGELITRATLVIDLPDIYTPQLNAIQQQYPLNRGRNRVVAPSWAWTNSLGHAICSEVQMLIGDQIVDRFDSRALECLDEQTRPVEHFDSTNLLIARDPTTFTDQQTIQLYGTGVPGQSIAVPQTNPQTLEIVFPFWWNRGPGPQALPIQALWKDKVQFKVTFRPVQECVYTSTRIDPRNPPLSTNQGTGPLPNIADCGFFINDASGVPIYNAASTADLASTTPTNPFFGSVLESPRMPAAYHFTDAYWIVEYVSLEDREASVYRMADLEIPFEQHVPMPVITTGGSADIRIRMDQSGLVRDLTWVAQRVEAPSYNAHFLFSKDLADAAGPPTLIGPTPLAPVQNPCDIPWWPNTQTPDWNYGDGYILPAFTTRRSDPIATARMLIRGLLRFEHEAPSMFRSLIPALNCRRTPLIDRYIYRYDFGYWPTGGLAEAADLPVDEIRGCANWDKLPKRELALTMNQDSCHGSAWAVDTMQSKLIAVGSQFIEVDSHFAPTTAGFIVNLNGAHPNISGGTPDILGNNGNGAIVLGIVDFNQIRRQIGYIGLYIRTNVDGSASLVMKTTAGYTWIAVAGAGGYGRLETGKGGTAGSAVEIAWQGGNQAQSHEVVFNVGGTYVFNNMGRLNSLVTTTVLLLSPFFTINIDGLFQSVAIEFSRIASLDLAIATVEINLVVNATTYALEVENTLVDIPTQLQTFISAVPIAISNGDVVYIEFIPLLGSEPTVRVDASALPPLVACTIVVKEGSVGPLVTPIYGGGGGGRLAAAGIGQLDGTQMTTTAAFVESHQQTGGSTYTYHGGDGYYGGGSGTLGGGGGGSYVSSLITQINSVSNRLLFNVPDDTDLAAVGATLTPLTLEPTAQPNFNIYGWITRYNRLRINSGRGALMFNETT